MIRLLIASILFFTPLGGLADEKQREIAVSYTHLRAHET